MAEARGGLHVRFGTDTGLQHLATPGRQYDDDCFGRVRLDEMNIVCWSVMVVCEGLGVCVGVGRCRRKSTSRGLLRMDSFYVTGVCVYVV